jgi:hemolysin III
VSKIFNLQRLTSIKRLGLPYYTIGEELFSVVTHGIGAVISVVGFIFLSFLSFDNKVLMWCSLTYFLTSFLLYVTSTIYHCLPVKKIKKFFRKLDHCSIFLFIAGTYTPVGILLIGGQTGVTTLIIVWSVAFLGVIFNLIDTNRFAKFSLVTYIALGWGTIFSVEHIIKNSSLFELIMLFGGGVVYTVGTIIYVLGKKIRYMHSIWHLFVLAASILHFFLIYSLFSRA